MVRVFVNGLGDLGSIPGRIIPKTLKMVLDNSLLNIQQYKVRIEGKVEQSREVAIEKGAFWLPSSMIANFILLYIPIFQFRCTVKKFQVFLFNTNNSIQHYSFVFIQLNGSVYCYVSLTF